MCRLPSISTEQDFCASKLFINGNATQIQQMLMNLMNNARDALAGTSKPVIRVTLRKFEPDAAFVETHAKAKQHPYGCTLGCR